MTERVKATPIEELVALATSLVLLESETTKLQLDYVASPTEENKYAWEVSEAGCDIYKIRIRNIDSHVHDCAMRLLISEAKSLDEEHYLDIKQLEINRRSQIALLMNRKVPAEVS